jgi:4'-phosphopantetheinyl transferase
MSAESTVPFSAATRSGIGEVRLARDQAAIWWLRLDTSAPVPDSFHELLTDDERRRAERLMFPADRCRFVRTRAALRQLLALLLRTTPDRVQFQYSPHGKPSLVGEEPELCFNVSHSGEVAVLAFRLGAEVGVDIERVRDLDNPIALAARSFSPMERAELCAVAEERRLIAFFNGWTRKEAYVKATGSGMTAPLDRFDVSLGEPASLLRIDGSVDRAAAWRLFSFSPVEGYVAAAAWRGPDCPCILREWSDDDLVPRVHRDPRRLS